MATSHGGSLDVTRSPWQSPEQLAAEAAAARILASDAVRQARAHVSHLWRLAYGEDASTHAPAQFDAAMDEYCANWVLKATASDAHHPRFVCNFMTPRGPVEQGLMGARAGGDNPDNVYRLAGIAHDGRYRVQGQLRGQAPSNVSFTLVGNYGTSVTLQTIELHNMQVDEQGRFTIDIDDQASGAHSNHLCTVPNVKFLFVRDSLNDWSLEHPLALSIERLNPTGDAPIDEAEMTRRAVFRMVEDVPLYYWFTRLFSGKPVNFMQVQASAGIGGLVTQAGTQGHFRIGDDEALLIRVDPAGARYCSLWIYDWWFRSVDADKRFTGRNLASSDADADGRITWVLSARDPGVVNWIDISGLPEGLMGCRWQNLPGTPLRQGPLIEQINRVMLSDLSLHLPAGHRRVSATERGAELQARARDFQRRLQPIDRVSLD